MKASDILPFTPGVPLECETGIAVRAGVQEPKKYGMRLLSGILSQVKDLARRGIIISKIYTRSSTPDGINLARGLGFQDIAPTPNQNNRLFELDVATSSSPFAQEYREISEKHSDFRFENTISSKR